MNECISLQDSLKNQVSATDIQRNALREEFSNLLSDALLLITEFDVRNANGVIIEHGYSVVETILIMERAGKNINGPIRVIGRENWNKLKLIWQRMREIEIEDKHLISILN